MPTSPRTLSAIAGGFAVCMIAVSTANAQDAAPSAVKGQDVFNSMCSGCHSDVKDDNGAKLSLFGVVGRKAGTASGFSYSAAMTGSGITWTADKIDAFVTAPSTVVPDTAMYFGGLADPADRANVIAYLKTLK